jgi:acyl carrier protein
MATFDDVREVLRDVLQLGPRADGFDANTSLLGGIPEFDSAAVVSVVMALEDRFGFEIEDEEINADAFETVGTLTDFVDGKLAA